MIKDVFAIDGFTRIFRTIVVDIHLVHLLHIIDPVHTEPLIDLGRYSIFNAHVTANKITKKCASVVFDLVRFCVLFIIR